MKRPCFLKIIERWLLDDAPANIDFYKDDFKTIREKCEALSLNNYNSYYIDSGYFLRKFIYILRSFSPIEEECTKYIPWLPDFLKNNLDYIIGIAQANEILSDSCLWRHLIENKIAFDELFYNFKNKVLYYLPNLRAVSTFKEDNTYSKRLLYTKIYGLKPIKEKYNEIINNEAKFEIAKRLLKSSSFNFMASNDYCLSKDHWCNAYTSTNNFSMADKEDVKNNKAKIIEENGFVILLRKENLITKLYDMITEEEIRKKNN